jgi:hypothetical protein
MSIYNALSIDIPLIGYSIFHQSKKTVSPKEYSKYVLHLHRDIVEESTALLQKWTLFLNGLREKSIQSTRGGLSQFLSTPLQTDMNEIERIIGDQLQRIAQQVLDPGDYGSIGSFCYKVLFEKQSLSDSGALLNQGKKYLRDLGFNLGSSKSSILESIFLINGGQNLDLLEHIIRDRIGVFTGSHGKHVGQFQNGAFSIANATLLWGDEQHRLCKFEAAIHFSKRKGNYDELRQKIRDAAGNVVKTNKQVKQIWLWQRKLGLGAISEFTLRIRAQDKAVLKDGANEMMRTLASKKEYSAIVRPVCAYTKELLT